MLRPFRSPWRVEGGCAELKRRSVTWYWLVHILASVVAVMSSTSPPTLAVPTPANAHTLHTSRGNGDASHLALQRCGRMLLRGHAQPAACLAVTEKPDGAIILTVAPGGCLELSTETTDHWYGGPPMASARWPSSLGRIVTQPWRSNDMLGDRSKIGSLLDGIWLTSSGVSVCLLPNRAALDLSFNDRDLPDASQEGCVLRLRSTGEELVNLELRVSDDVRAAHRQLASRLERPTAPQPPALELMRAPIWSTWARYKMAVDQVSVEGYASEIAAAGFPRSQLEIDDKWCAHYGDFSFDSAKFPDPAGMVRRLHDLGFAVTLWVTPFAELPSEAYAEGAAAGHWLTKSGGSGEPAVVRWWQGDGVLLNVSDSGARAWFKQRMQRLVDETGVDGFKFDAGEGEFVPGAADADANANAYATDWAKFAAEFGGRGELRCMRAGQGAGVWTREFDKDSRWGLENGLGSLLVTALQHGVLGYPFVLPDMIGGNAYSEELLLSGSSTGGVQGKTAPQSHAAGNSVEAKKEAVVASTMFFGALPDRELYLRWCFANALLPAVQFSIAPWQYDDAATAACRKALDLRARYLPTLEALATRALATGEPIVRPLWWHDPEDSVCLTVDDAFLLGDTTLVAPVLEPGASSRRVYLPRGSWASVGPEPRTLHVGPVWIEDYPVALDELGVFELVV